jgi:hypothetical protein
MEEKWKKLCTRSRIFPIRISLLTPANIKVLLDILMYQNGKRFQCFRNSHCLHHQGNDVRLMYVRTDQWEGYVKIVATDGNCLL